MARIKKELAGIAQTADFPVEFAEVASVNNVKQMADSPEVKAADVVIVYGAGIGVNGCQNFGKDVIIFQRHRSGPVYLQYEIVSPRFLRQHKDELALRHITFDDVVTDSLDELTWRLRSSVWSEEHAEHEDPLHRRGRRLGPAGGRDSRVGQEGLEPRHADRHLRRSRPLDSMKLERTTRPLRWPRKRAEAILGGRRHHIWKPSASSSTTASCSIRFFAI